MKYQKIILSVLSLVTLIVIFGFCSTITNSPIIGSWINEKDSNSKLIFDTNGNCKRYYEGELIEEYNFSISNTSPQCGVNVHVDSYTSYLKLTNINDANDFYCYEINGITASKLSLRPIENGGFILYNKE